MSESFKPTPLELAAACDADGRGVKWNAERYKALCPRYEILCKKGFIKFRGQGVSLTRRGRKVFGAMLRKGLTGRGW